MNQLRILEMRSQEMEAQRQSLQMHPDHLSEFTSMTYDGDNGDCLEIVAMLLIALMHVEFVSSWSNNHT